ncbi:MAG: hypothetical protein KA164_17255 [Rhodoferax sp.]|nr:hypothetical protein [Rhodoferax sp.]
MPDTPLALPEGSCHCGAVCLVLPAAPATATDCNCSICRRLDALWAFYPFGSVKIGGHPQNTQAYIWGARTLRTVRCANCGLATHWEPLDPHADPRVGVNLHNFDPQLVARVRVRHFDGAPSWIYRD